MKNFQTIVVAVLVIFSLNACKNKKTENADNTANNTKEEVDMHNAENSLDWSGYYFGTLPCASCPGIRTSITLDENGTYERTMEYIGEEDGEIEVEKGKFQWSADKTKITIGENQYFVGEGTLTALDAEGKKITGELAENYVLKKSELQEEPTANDGVYLEEYSGDDGNSYFIVLNTNGKVPTALVESKSGDLKIELAQTAAWAKGAEYMKDNVKLTTSGKKATLYFAKKKIELTYQK